MNSTSGSTPHLETNSIPASAAAPEFTRDIQPILAEKCYSCHGPEKQKSGLRLDRKGNALAGGESGKIILPGKSAESLLIRYVSGLDPEKIMPPKGERLTTNQVALLRAWVDSGAPWPDAAGQPTLHAPRSTPAHWSFDAPQHSTLPQVQNKRWVRNPIDAFILARLESEGLTPSPEADRAALIRRLSLDLAGLPPAPEQVRQFMMDRRPDAYELLVDSLLASPHFGERWGRHWLDLARYGDSEGYQIDRARPYAYVYRNWVIDSFNRDQPFDRFTIEQLAGDLLPNATAEQKTAVGFHRNTLMNYEKGTDQEEFRSKAKIDRVSTTGAVWLGLTVGCAECHTHKYDPITQREFYRLYAFFNRAQEIDISAPQSAELAKYSSQKKTWETENARLKELLAEYAAKKDPRLDALKLQMAGHEKQMPVYTEAKAQAFVEDPSPVKTFIHVRGDFRRPGDEVQPGTLSALHAFKPRGSRPDRLDLAQWLVDPANPLTSRVAVNHLWQHLFNRGLVNTPEDFGTRGEPPSHPELLDWLATEFIHRGWSRKTMIKLIVTSAAYRQSSHLRPELIERDPLNVLLARQNRFRLEAEIVRDVYLAAGGLLNTEIGGPSFRPPTPEDFKAMGLAGAFQWTDTEGAEKYRRGLYIFAQRTVPYPVSITFDAANPSETCARRECSDTPLQALALLNNPVFIECAEGLAQRMHRQRNLAPGQRIEFGFELCLGRKPTKLELARLESLYEVELRLASKTPPAAAARSTCPAAEKATQAEAPAFMALAQTILNLDEFVTRE